MTRANRRTSGTTPGAIVRSLVGLAIAGMLTVPTMSAKAQSGRAQSPRPTVSCGPAALILLAVRDERGTAVSGAKVRVVRRSDRRLVHAEAQESVPAGEYVVMDDSFLPLTTKRGTKFDVTVRYGRQLVKTVITVGRTPDGCHVRLLGPPSVVTIHAS
jgi:hypothetical protein